MMKTSNDKVSSLTSVTSYWCQFLTCTIPAPTIPIPARKMSKDIGGACPGIFDTFF
jgi:hypothetical protein